MRASRVAILIAMGLFLVGCESTTSPTSATSPTPDRSRPTATAPSPTAAPLPIGPANMPIAAGTLHTCAITLGGGVSCWGEINGSFVPVDVAGLKNGVSAVAAGSSFSCALLSTGGVKCWGANYDGHLGDGTTTDSSVPVEVRGLTGGVTAIAAGDTHSCAVTAGGGVKCWGTNASGQLGNGTNISSSVPVDVTGLASGVSAVAAGGSISCALLGTGGVKCWGANGAGQLGDGTTTDSSVPVDVTGLGSGVSALEAGGLHACALTSGGGVECWGGGEQGQPGTGSTANSGVPKDVPGLIGGVRAIAAGGGNETCALTTLGGVKCWGASATTPTDIAGLASGVGAITVGDLHTCAIASGGAQCWGWNYFGQLGTGTACLADSITPVNVASATKPPGAGATGAPPARIEHATGPNDVVLRFDDVVVLRDTSAVLDDPTGRFFRPGPEFTLYGDGTIIVRDELAPLPPAEGSIIRARPFQIGRLAMDQVQALLRFAIGDGGLGNACDRYDAQGDADISSVFTIRAGGFDRRIEVLGPSPLSPLAAYLRAFDGGSSIPTKTWVPTQYWGRLIDLGDLPSTGAIPWPWPGFGPAAFVVPPDQAFLAEGSRAMSTAEAAALGLSKNGGVVARIYLAGPGAKTIYAFSMWPMLPDEPR